MISSVHRFPTFIVSFSTFYSFVITLHWPVNDMGMTYTRIPTLEDDAPQSSSHLTVKQLHKEIDSKHISITTVRVSFYAFNLFLRVSLFPLGVAFRVCFLG